ncbi:hypothetical protein ACFQZX_02620 [Mucilaginibacter litoreus]|uniref:Uncharacterized protein n=1 Tax=Mucilaginibacter litoreus TaxID=1048221 RepID=A0ABW3ANS7_9SPHI
MITPPEEQDDMLQQDDQLGQTENEEQMSQQDLHSNGFDDTNEDIGETDETPQANQAYDAAEPSYTLNLDEDNQAQENE